MNDFVWVVIESQATERRVREAIEEQSMLCVLRGCDLGEEEWSFYSLRKREGRMRKLKDQCLSFSSSLFFKERAQKSIKWIDKFLFQP